MAIGGERRVVICDDRGLEESRHLWQARVRVESTFVALTVERFNRDLSWSSHLANVSRKMSRAIRVIHSIKYNFSVYIFTTLYNSLN